MQTYDNSNLAVPFDVDEHGEIHVYDDKQAVREAWSMQTGVLITREEIEGLAKVDQDFVNISEQIRDMALDAIRDQRDIAAMLDTKSRAQAIGAYLLTKIQAREAKLQAQNNIAEIRIRYERELGKLIKKLQTDGELLMPGKKQTSQSQGLSLRDYKVSYSQSSRWQSMADLPDEKFEAQLNTIKENGWELTSAAIFRHGENHNDKHAVKLYDNTLPVADITEHIKQSLGVDGEQRVRVVVYEVEPESQP